MSCSNKTFVVTWQATNICWLTMVQIRFSFVDIDIDHTHIYIYIQTIRLIIEEKRRKKKEMFIIYHPCRIICARVDVRESIFIVDKRFLSFNLLFAYISKYCLPTTWFFDFYRNYNPQIYFFVKFKIIFISSHCNCSRRFLSSSLFFSHRSTNVCARFRASARLFVDFSLPNDLYLSDR